MAENGAVAVEAAPPGPDWLALPNGVLQLIIYLASTWQTPGPCLAASVCSTWRAAAAGCKGICLLYNTGLPASDQSLAAWIGRNGHRLESFTLSSHSRDITNMLLGALATASSPAPAPAAAAAAGGEEAGTGVERPLLLHTLCVMGWGPSVDIVGRLLPALPYVRRLQLFDIHSSRLYGDTEQRQRALAALKQATQLQELHIQWPSWGGSSSPAAAALLPPSLKHLTWRTCDRSEQPDWSHLTQLTSLQLGREWDGPLSTEKLPPRLQEMNIVEEWVPGRLPHQWPELVVGAQAPVHFGEYQLSSLVNLRTLAGSAQDLSEGPVRTLLPQLAALSALRVCVRRTGTPAADQDLKEVVSTAGGIRGLKRLEVELCPGQVLVNLSPLTAVTHLSLVGVGRVKRRAAWAAEVGKMVWLKRLAVSHVLMLEQPWMGNLKQLQVLDVVLLSPGTTTSFVYNYGVYPSHKWSMSCSWASQWVEGDNLRAVAPQLRLLMVTGMPPDPAAPLQLRRRLQQLVGSGCEVVVGMFDPTQQLAALPEALQQALL